jgi:hypothetical protein
MTKHVSRLLAILLFTTLGCAQSDQILPNENLAVEGVPPIPSMLVAVMAGLPQRPFEFAQLQSALGFEPSSSELPILTPR